MNAKKILAASFIVSMFAVTAVQAEQTDVTIKAQKLIEYNQFTQAADLLKKEPNNIDAQALKIVLLAKQFKLDPAQIQLDKLMKDNSRCADLHYAQGVIYVNRTASSDARFYRNKDLLNEQALKEFNLAVSLDKKHYRALNAAGVVALRLGKNEDAKKYFQEALNIDSNYARAIDNLGTLDMIENNLAAAETKFRKALSVNSKNPTAMYHLAQVMFAKGDYSSALKYLNDARAIHPNSAAILNLMGEAYEKQGNQAAAIVALNKAINIKPENQMPYLNLAEIYENRADAEFAIAPLKTVLAINPDAKVARLKIAEISYANGDYKQAVENYSYLVNSKDYGVQALKGLADSYYELAKSIGVVASRADFVRTYDYLEKAIKAQPDDLELYLAKIKMAKAAGMDDLSEEALNKIVEAPATSLSDIVAKGEAYLALYKNKEAKETFEQAINASKNHNEDVYLMQILTYDKQFDEAKAVADKILKDYPTDKDALATNEMIEKSKILASDFYYSGRFFFKERNRTSAYEYLVKSTELNPENIKAQLLLGKTSQRLKRYPEAVAAYKSYTAVEPSLLINHRVKKLEKKINRLNAKKEKELQKASKKSSGSDL